MTLLTLGLYLPLWFCYGLAQSSSFLDSFISFPGENTVSMSPLCVCVCVSLSMCMCACTVLCIVHRARTVDAEVC